MTSKFDFITQHITNPTTCNWKWDIEADNIKFSKNGVKFNHNKDFAGQKKAVVL